MKVRDRTMLATGYKGRPTDALDSECPCRACYNAHDCGYGAYGGHVVAMECATRWNNGCPNPLPTPKHVFTSVRGKVCRRCGGRR